MAAQRIINTIAPNPNPGVLNQKIDGMKNTLQGIPNDNAHLSKKEEAKNILAPHLFQQKMGADKRIGLVIEFAKLRDAVAKSAQQGFHWDQMVCYMGLEEDMVTLRPIVIFYAVNPITGVWTEVDGVMSGGGGGGVAANSTPPPTQ
jgi:hypothetical protein